MAGEVFLASLQRRAGRVPYVPILGELAAELGQVPFEVYASDAQAQAVALAQTVQALYTDAATVGVGTDPAVGCDVLPRLRPLLADQALAAVVPGADVAATRAYCEAGAQVLFVVTTDAGARLKTLANAARFYDVPTILVDLEDDDAAAAAAAHGMSGAIVAAPTGDEDGVVGGGLTLEHVANPGSVPTVPRADGFFWSFFGELPAGLRPEDLAVLGATLTA
ncbi:MAG: hypothetical protein M0013_01550 [Actinomycetota bacterium]|nr:hypothetical protein [Actinomycetota bacterium]